MPTSARASDSPVNRTRSRSRPRSNSAPLPPRSAWGAAAHYARQAKAERPAANQAEAEAQASSPARSHCSSRVVGAPPAPANQDAALAAEWQNADDRARAPRVAEERAAPPAPRQGLPGALPASPMTVATAVPPAPPSIRVQARVRRAARDHLSAEKRGELARDGKHELVRATRARFEDPGDLDV